MKDKAPKTTLEAPRKTIASAAKSRVAGILAAVSGWRVAAKILRQSQSPMSHYHEFAGKVAVSPLTIMIVTVIPLSVLTRFSAPPFHDLSLVANVVILTVAALLYAIALRAWLGRWFYFAVGRNIPLVLVYCSFYLTAHTLFHFVLGAMFLDASIDRSWQRYSNTVPIAVFFSILVVMVFAPLARNMLSKHGSLVPIFWPISVQTARQVSIFGSADVGRLRWMQAQQKGVRVVTDQRDVFVRRALAELVAQIAPQTGLHCHRNLWVANEEVRDLVYLNGNPHVVLRDETLFPVSRTAVDDLRSLALQNKSHIISGGTKPVP